MAPKKEKDTQQQFWDSVVERGKELYEQLESEIDPSAWDVPVHSAGKDMPLRKFYSYANERTDINNYRMYRPDEVIRDAGDIFRFIEDKLSRVKQDFLASFKSILLAFDNLRANNEMYQERVQESDTQIQKLSAQIKKLETENERLQQENKTKREGIAPLFMISKMKMNHIINIYEQFKEIIGDEQEMKKYHGIIEDEVNTAIELIKIKHGTLFPDDDTIAKTDIEPEVQDDIFEPKQETTQQANVSDEEIPKEFEHAPPDVYRMAKQQVDDQLGTGKEDTHPRIYHEMIQFRIKTIQEERKK